MRGESSAIGCTRTMECALMAWINSGQVSSSVIRGYVCLSFRATLTRRHCCGKHGDKLMKFTDESSTGGRRCCVPGGMLAPNLAPSPYDEDHSGQFLGGLA